MADRDGDGGYVGNTLTVGTAFDIITDTENLGNRTFGVFVTPTSVLLSLEHNMLSTPHFTPGDAPVCIG